MGSNIHLCGCLSTEGYSTAAKASMIARVRGRRLGVAEDLRLREAQCLITMEEKGL